LLLVEQSAVKVIKTEFMEKDPSTMRFTMLALVRWCPEVAVGYWSLGLYSAMPEKRRENQVDAAQLLLQMISWPALASHC